MIFPSVDFLFPAFKIGDHFGDKSARTMIVEIWIKPVYKEIIEFINQGLVDMEKPQVLSDYRPILSFNQSIKQIFFPRYTPELNPHERVWDDSKEKVIKNRFILDIEKTTEDFVNYLNANY